MPIHGDESKRRGTLLAVDGAGPDGSDTAVLEFIKLQGLGNDFILLDRRTEGGLLELQEAIGMCDRRRGVGADGVLTLLGAETGIDARLKVQNSDGSVPEMCGNGLRCAIRYLAENLGRPSVRVQTDVGVLEGKANEAEIEAALGRGHRVGTKTANFGCHVVEGIHIEMGNPHWVLPIDTHQALRTIALEFGPQLQKDLRFPQGVNVGFAKQHANEIELVVFERGAGLTEACGTGAGAAALALYKGPRAVPVRLPGGTLTIQLPADEDDWIRMKGPAEEVFRGTL